MNLKQIAIATGVVLLLLLLFLWPDSSNTLVEIEGHHGQTGRTPPIIEFPPPEKIAETRAIIDQGNVPIDFWGRIVDEDGEGLKGVDISFKSVKALVSFGGRVSDQKVQGKVVSDTSGRFRITGTRGYMLVLESIQKAGFVTSANQSMSFAYSNNTRLHAPIRESPFEIVMRKIGSGSGVTRYSEMGVQLSWDGAPVQIHLNDGTKMNVTAFRAGTAGKFDWNLSVSIDGAQIREATSGGGHVAPKNGYQPFWKCGFLSSDSNWRFGKRANVFYKKGDRYGRLSLNIYADAKAGRASVYAQQFANLQGGRNTEPD